MINGSNITNITNIDGGAITTGTVSADRLPVMVGADGASNGVTTGLVPSGDPSANGSFLRGDATWVAIATPPAVGEAGTFHAGDGSRHLDASGQCDLTPYIPAATGTGNAYIIMVTNVSATGQLSVSGSTVISSNGGTDVDAEFYWVVFYYTSA